MTSTDIFPDTPQPEPFDKREMEEVPPDPLDSEEVQKALTFQEQIRSPIFGAILVFCLVGAFAFMASIFEHQTIVDIELKYGYGISTTWFFVLAILCAILVAYMVYKPYIISRAQGSTIVLYALIFYVLTQVAWSLVLFQSRVNRGVPGLAGVFLLATTVWLGWVCYHFAEESILIFFLLLAWCFYLQSYTYNVDAHPWRKVD